MTRILTALFLTALAFIAVYFLMVQQSNNREEIELLCELHGMHSTQHNMTKFNKTIVTRVCADDQHRVFYFEN